MNTTDQPAFAAFCKTLNVTEDRAAHTLALETLCSIGFWDIDNKRFTHKRPPDCQLCGRRSTHLATWFPLQSMVGVFGAPPASKTAVRVVVYGLCNHCAKNFAGAARRVEDQVFAAASWRPFIHDHDFTEDNRCS